MRRALIVVLLGLVLAGAATVTWQAMGKAKLVEEDALRPLGTTSQGASRCPMR